MIDEKKIGILLSCALVIGMFSVGALPTKAVGCSHPLYYTNVGISKWERDADKHREWRGTQWVCTTCGYTYWTNLELIKSEEHQYPVYAIDSNGKPIYGDTCKICGYKK